MTWTPSLRADSCVSIVLYVQLQARVHATLQECVPTWHSVTAFHLNGATAPSLLVQHAHPVHGALVTTPLTMYKRQVREALSSGGATLSHEGIRWWSQSFNCLDEMIF